MSKIKSKATPPDSKGGADPQLRNKIRAEIRSVAGQKRSIDRDAIKAKFLKQYPDKAWYINVVVDDNSVQIQKRFAQQSQASQTEPSEKKNSIISPTPAAPKQMPQQVEVGGEVEEDSSDDMTSETSATSQAHPVEQPSYNVLLKEFRDDLDTQDLQRLPDGPISTAESSIPSLHEQVQFLNSDPQQKERSNASTSKDLEHAILLTPSAEKSGLRMPSQFALLGQLDQSHSDKLADPRVMLNTNIPFSAFICGLQGSGKSHTTSCIIENCSLTFPALGNLKKPVSTLVLNYNEYSSNVSSQPSEAAFLASLMPQYSSRQTPIPVRVLVSPTNFQNLGKMYSQIPKVEVRPFKLQPRHLNISMMLSLMSMGKNDHMPLYMSQVVRILREMAIKSGGHFDYSDFRKRLTGLRLDRAQTPFLYQRLDLLDSYLDLSGQGESDYFIDGGVSILDLSCPFVDENTACILFRIAIDLFLYAHPSRGKMIVADEAHKYMIDTPAAKELTETFLNIIRQQRHLGVRTIISTQEPTISPRLIDLCSITVIHRFSSPEWYRAIQKHVPIENKREGDEGATDGFYRISSLRTGEALIYAPSSYLLKGDRTEIDTKHGTFKMGVRKRVTWDGGRTIVCIR